MLTRANIVLNFYTVRFESNFVCVDPSPDLCTLHCTLLWHSVLTHADSPPAIGIRAISPIPCHWRQSPSSQLILRTVAGPKQPGAICQEKNAVCSKNLWGIFKKKTFNKLSPTSFCKKTNSHHVYYDLVAPHAFGFCSSWSHSWAANQADSTPLAIPLKIQISYHLHGYLLASYRVLVDIAGRRYDAPWHFCCRTCSYTSPPAAGAALPRLARGGMFNDHGV